MSKRPLAPMLLLSAVLTAPVLAATTDTSSPATPAAPSDTTPASAATTAPVRPGTGAPAAAQADNTPRYETSDRHVRLAKVVGATVYNDKDESIGSIDDVLMEPDHKANMAVISVGGFLGIGSKLVSVPFDQLKIEKDKIVMPGATKDALKGMPDYKYNNT
jgi:sporulation protein YlmC with PRC-barrel domain